MTHKTRVVRQEDLDPGFFDFFTSLPGGEQILSCIQCGTCSGSCPFANDMDHTPRAIIAMMRAGMVEDVLNSTTPYYCASCYSCAARCPRDINITEVMYLLKNISQVKGKYGSFYSIFGALTRRYGRMFEGELTLRAMLKTDPLKLPGFTPLGIRMFLKGKLKPLPSLIAGRGELQRLYDYAQEAGSVGREVGS